MASKVLLGSRALRARPLVHLFAAPSIRSYSSPADELRAILRKLEEKESISQGRHSTPESSPIDAKTKTKGWRHMSKGDRDPYDNKVDTYGDKIIPEPYRNGLGGSIMGPKNTDRDIQNPDMVRPPSTDSGTLSNMKWSYSDSHNRIEEGGWARQTTNRELTTSKELAGVNMRLECGAVRELHWHKEAEWAYMISGKARVTTIDVDGGNYIEDLGAGDLWYFPSGNPHSIQGLAPEGCEFLLIFDDGGFSEDSTFLLSDWLAHTPKSVLGKNFRLDPQIFDHIPASEKYIFSATLPKSIDKEIPDKPGVKPSKRRFVHRMLAQDPIETEGGEVRITDSTNFPISKTVAAAHVKVNPGGLREMHWHPNADEWSYFISGRARVTVFASGGTARTFDYMPGDVGIVPQNMGHYVENLSDTEPLEFLEIFKADKFQDFSLEQWLGQTPERLVGEHIFQDHPKLAKRFVDNLDARKTPIKRGK